MHKTTHRFSLKYLFIILLLTLIFYIPSQAQQADDDPVVRAVLFYSPTCGFCEKVIQNELPPLIEQYGDQLKIVAINISLPEGQEIYNSTVEFYDIPDERLGVPTLVVADIVLVGGEEIPQEFPLIVSENLEAGGVEWPPIPGFDLMLQDVNFSPSPNNTSHDRNQTSSNMDGETQSIIEKFKRDPVANTIAVLTLIGMVISIIWVVISFTRPLSEKDFWPTWIVPILSVLGMGVAIYLTYIETSGAQAVCGPVGDCNTVQLSPYAELFGFLPVGVLGMIGYTLIIIGWLLSRSGPQSIRWISSIAVWGMAFFGVLFSIYLTFLEPFVIGATCMWCISSAIFQTIIFLAATGPAKRAWKEDDFDDEDFADDEVLMGDPESS